MHFTARIVCCLALAITLSGCSKFSMPDMPSFNFGLPKLPSVHKFDIQQGNIITQDMVDQLKPGMTKSQVRFVMGTPLIADTFSQNRWDYFYSLKPAKSDEVRERLAIFFKDDLLVGLRGDFVPGGGNSQQTESTEEQQLGAAAEPTASANTEEE